MKNKSDKKYGKLKYAKNLKIDFSVIDNNNYYLFMSSNSTRTNISSPNMGLYLQKQIAGELSKYVMRYLNPHNLNKSLLL